MALVLWLAAMGLLILSILLDDDRAPAWVRLIGTAVGWIGPLVLLAALACTMRGRVVAYLRGQLMQLAGPALIRAMPPRTVLESVLSRIFGNGRGHQEILTGLLGGAGRDAGGGDSAVSRRTSAHFQIETLSEKQCISYLTWTHEYAGIRNNHRFVIFATSDREIARLVQSERVFPLFELWLVGEEDLEEFVPALRESLRVGISYVDKFGELHVIEPRPEYGEEVAFRHYDQYVHLPDHVDRKDLRIVQLDLYDLAHDDHVVSSVETLTMRASNVGAFDLGYLVWSPPHPCFVETVTFDVSRLARPGEDLVYLVVLGTIKGAGLPINRWLPLVDHIEVPVESWMLSGHNVTLLYRPTTTAEIPHVAQSE